MKSPPLANRSGYDDGADGNQSAAMSPTMLAIIAAAVAARCCIPSASGISPK
jgi:hypothetical protein